MNKIKIIVILIFLLLIGLNIYADDVSVAIDDAKGLYESGNIQGALNKIAEIKLTLEHIVSSNTSNEYEEVNWDKVKMLTDNYLNKKVVIHSKLSSIQGDNTVWLSAVGLALGNTYEESLIDTILGLEMNHKEYKFYGTVITDKYSRVILHIEKIE